MRSRRAYRGSREQGAGSGEQGARSYNLHGLYSFHPGGVHIAFGDGSVQFIADSVSTQTVFALITREGGEIVSADTLQ